MAYYTHMQQRQKHRNIGRGEQVNTHYLPGAGTNYERKKYRKKKKEKSIENYRKNY